MIWGIKEIAAHGADATRTAAIVAGLAVALGFVRRQRRHRNPMLDLSLVRRRAFAGSLAVSLLSTFVLVGFAVFSTQYLQLVLGMSPLAGALWSLVPSVGVGAAAPLGAHLAKRGVDRATIMAAGFGLAATGFAVLTTVGNGFGLLTLLIGAGSYAAGLVMVMSLATELVMGTVPADRAGASSALMETASEFGGALGIAVLGSIGTAVYRGHLTGAPQPVRETLSGAVAAAAHLPGPDGAALLTAARAAFVASLHVAAQVGAVTMLVAAVLTLSLLRRARVPAATPVPPADSVPASANH